ncbi:MATE family efflux transporter [Noviherbaspirillum cavernae]|uniref:Multidrug-efflux transporter n=1 Tax=Noviherbaspirillum cavernae TaxID=2320862 RepID=A0A418WYL5_9BURK|nr:MATE family efflux transporter [Noviherbaspirillum cavernae]RJG05339.1 MATE family efflux transporter [Noviherbaspirillum cavernae]
MQAKKPRHTTRIAALAWPILVGQLAVIANGVIDTAMTSRFSATDLAALAVGASIYVSVFVGLSGVLQALSPIIAQLFGAQRFDDIGVEIKQGAWLAVFLSVIGCVALLFPQPLLSMAHASPELTEKCTLYLRILTLALPVTLGFRIYGAFNTAIGRPKALMAIQIISLLLKVPLNALFIFGGFGLPAFGGPGCAMATAVVAWLMALLAWIILRTDRSYRVYAIFNSGFVPPKWAAQLALLKLGIPMGLSYLIEVTAFTFMALFIARIGDTAVAGHQITANFATVLYMLPLSIASATSTLVAQAIGARDMEKARRVGLSGIRLAAILSVTIGCMVWLTRDWIVRAYTPNETIIAAALPLFFFIAFYQLFDAVQVTTAFVLRAYKVAVIPTVMYAVALWGVGLGGGYVLGLDPFGVSPPALRGAAGFWFGNSASLALVAAGLLWYLHVVQRDAMRNG